MENSILNPINSLELYGFEKYFNDYVKLLDANKFPKISLFSGKKGIGKFTLANHLMCYLFDKKNYDINKRVINNNSLYYNQLSNNTFANLIVLNIDKNNIKIDNIRKLRNTLSQTSINNAPRFIILDDVELFNLNSLNALLKLIEEPNINNYFILINNQEKDILQTIKSRCIESKFFLSNKKRGEISKKLLMRHNLEIIFNYEDVSLTPGFFILFNKLCFENDINFNQSYLSNMIKILNLYKKLKQTIYIKLAIFYYRSIFLPNDKKKH